MKLRELLFALFLVFVLSLSYGAEKKELTILHTNDIHARLVPTFNKDFNEVCGGASERSGLINLIRKEVGENGILLLDSGDLSQGTPFFNVFKGKANFSAAKLIGYDAITTGNHEFGNGMAALQNLLAETNMRLLCCNVVHKSTNKPVFKPYQVFIRNGLKIAVIGCIGRGAWEDTDIKIRAPMNHIHEIEAVKSYAKRLRPYVNLIVVISHSGIDEDKAMAAQIGEIDIILGGHTHTALHAPILVNNNPDTIGCLNGLGGTIVAQAGEKGTFLGRLNLIIGKKGKIKEFSGELIRVKNEHLAYASPDVKELVNHYDTILRNEMNKVVAVSRYDLDYVKKGKRNEHMAMGAFTAEGMRYSANADICIINTGGVKTGIKKGDITKGDLFTAIPYDNTVVNFTMKGSEIKRSLDYLAANEGEYSGFQFAGISFVLNIPEKKSEQITIQGEPIDNDKTYVVATTSFMANGNDCGNVFFANVLKIEDKGILMRDAAVKYCEAIKDLNDFSDPLYKYIR